ncbi:MAG TPA: GldG family protein [Rhodanobacteraceae bacterium]
MRRAWQSWLYALLCVVIAICVAALSTHFAFTTDWSAGQRATITPQNQALLRQLPGPIRVTSYARPGKLRAQTSLLVQRYRRFKPDLSLRFVDPDLDPIATQAAGITANGELIIAWHGRQQRVRQIDEADFSDALVRLVRGGPKLVAFITGNGERSADGTGPADLGEFVKTIGMHGVRALPLNLADAAEVPRNVQLVVLASPQAVLLPESVQKLADYVADGGNLLWLTGPGSDDLGLAPLARVLGIRKLPGVLFDATAAATGTRDPRLLVTTRYPRQTITDDFDINAVFPRTAALAAVAGAQWDAQPILQSGADSWNQIAAFDPAQASTVAFDANAGELKGPLTFGYALTRLSPSPVRNQQRIVVIGSGAFLANAYLADAGNLAFGERVVNWLLGDTALASLPPAAPDAILKPSQLDIDVLSVGYLVALPIILIAIGFAIARRRRRR